MAVKPVSKEKILQDSVLENLLLSLFLIEIKMMIIFGIVGVIAVVKRLFLGLI